MGGVSEVMTCSGTVKPDGWKQNMSSLGSIIDNWALSMYSEQKVATELDWWFIVVKGTLQFIPLSLF